MFVSLVPHAQIEHHSREEPTFCRAQEEAGGEESGEILSEPREGADDTPQEGESRKPESRRREFEDDVTWDLEHDVTDEEDSQRGEVLTSGLRRTAVRAVLPLDTGEKRTHVCVRDQTLDASIPNWKEIRGNRAKERMRESLPLLRSKKERKKRKAAPGMRCKSSFLKSFLSSIIASPPSSIA